MHQSVCILSWQYTVEVLRPRKVPLPYNSTLVEFIMIYKEQLLAEERGSNRNSSRLQVIWMNMEISGFISITILQK